MKTLNRKYGMIIIGSAVTAAALFVTHKPIPQPVADKPGLENQTKPALVDTKPLQMAATVQPRPQADKPSLVKTVSPAPNAVAETFTGVVEVLQETYVEEDILDENWDEEAYMEEQRRLMQTMTKEELAARAQIHALEAELHQVHNDIELDETLLTQMEQLLQTDDEYSPQLLDLLCTSTLCRVAIDVVDEFSQFEVLDALPDQLEWVEQSYADVTVKLDDSRMLTVYLSRAEVVDDINEY